MSDRMRKSIIPSKGLQNAAGENNCFLNSAVQVLWHLDVFRQNFRLLTDHACVGRSCIFCGLKVIFTSFEFSDESSLPPLALRSALAKAFEAAQRFQMGAMDDAAECFESILTGLHTNCAYGHDPDKCNQRHCLTHEKFAMKQNELLVCECGARSTLSESVQLVHYIPTTSLVDQVSDADMSFGQKLKYAYTHGDRLKSCPAKCGKNAITHRYLSNSPDVISIGLIWTNDSPELCHIRNFVLTIEPSLLLSDLFECEHTNSVQLKLVGMVCYYGKHYSTFFFHSRTKKWISFDDESVTEIGSEWDDVIEKVVRGRYQPLLLLYQNLKHQHISTATAFKKTFEITLSDLNGSKPRPSHNTNNNSSSSSSGLKVLRAPFVPSSSSAVNSGIGQFGSRITACNGAPVLASPTTSGIPYWTTPAGNHGNIDLLSTRTNSVVRHSTQPLIPLSNPAAQPSQLQFAPGGITGWQANSQVPPNSNQLLLNYGPVAAGAMRYGAPNFNPPLMHRYVIPVQAYPISNPPPIPSQFSTSALHPVLNNYNGFRQPELHGANHPGLLQPQQNNHVPGGGGYPVTNFCSVPSSFQPPNQLLPSMQPSYSQSQQPPPPAHPPAYMMNNNFPSGQSLFQSPQQLPQSRFPPVPTQASLPEPLIPVAQPLPAQPFRQSFTPAFSGSAGPSAAVRPSFDPANAGAVNSSTYGGAKDDNLQKADDLMTLCAIKEKAGDLHAALLCCNQATLLYKQAVQRMESSSIPCNDLENIRVKSNVTFLESRRLYAAIQSQYGAIRAAENAKRSPGASKTGSVLKVTPEVDSKPKEKLPKNPVELPDISEMNLDPVADTASNTKDNLIQLDETVPDVRQLVLKEQVNHLYGQPARLGAVRVRRADLPTSHVPTVTAFLQKYGCQHVIANKNNSDVLPSTNLPSSTSSQTSLNGPSPSAGGVTNSKR